MKRTLTLALATLALGSFIGCSSSSSSSGSATDAGVVRPDVGTSGQADVGTGGGSTGGDNCGAIVACVNNCQDQSCVDDCSSTGSAAGKSQFDALFTCANTKCASASSDAAFQQCIQAECGGEIAGCEGLGGGGGGGGTGTGGCADLVQCLNGCQQSDQTCRQGCAGAASQTALTNYQALVQCAQTNNCTNPQTQQQCLQANCSAQVNACLSN